MTKDERDLTILDLDTLDILSISPVASLISFLMDYESKVSERKRPGRGRTLRVAFPYVRHDILRFCWRYETCACRMAVIKTRS